MKDLKQSTKQRFTALDFNHPEPEDEAAIVVREGGVDNDMALKLVEIAQKACNLKVTALTKASPRACLCMAR